MYNIRHKTILHITKYKNRIFKIGVPEKGTKISVLWQGRIKRFSVSDSIEMHSLW